MEEKKELQQPVHKILCVVSVVREGAQPDTYLAPNGERISGLQTNEAPVKYLLSRAANGTAVQIVYVASPEALTPCTIAQETISPAEYFCRQVQEYDGGQHALSFVPVLQEKEHPQKALTQLADLLHPGDTVDIDTTGGNRDGIALLMLVVQLMEYKHVHLGNSVYSNFVTHQIQHQDDTYRLVSLINALNAFTQNGKSDQIAAFFRSSQVSQIRQLLGAMERFSNDIAFNRTTKIAESVRQVNARLSLFEQMEQNQLNTFAEQMFQKLLPSLRDQFVATDEDENKMGINLIQWCTDRGLVMQALALFREIYPKCIRESGLIRFDADYLESLQPKPGDKRHFRMEPPALFVEGMIQTTAGKVNRGWSFCYRNLNADVLHRPFSYIDRNKVTFYVPEESAADLLFYFYQMRIVRNRTFHPGEERKEDADFLNKYRNRIAEHQEKLQSACQKRQVKTNLEKLRVEDVNIYLRSAIAALRKAMEDKSQLPQNR